MEALLVKIPRVQVVTTYKLNHYQKDENLVAIKFEDPADSVFMPSVMVLT